MLTNISAVIFDLDGTLIDSMWVWKQIDVDYLGQKGFSLPDDLQRNIQGLSHTQTAQYFKKRFNLEDDIETIKSDWNSMASEFYNSKINLKNGVPEFLAYLKEKDLKIGIATSSFKDLTLSVLTRTKILDYFDTIVTTCEVPRDKSYPDVFLEAAKRLNVIPSECLVFEDSIVSVRGAHAAGMKVAGIYDEYGTCTLDELTSECDYMFDNFKKLIVT